MSNKIEKLEKRLKFAFSENNFYEAHQISRTIYYRLLELERYSDLLKFLYANFLVLCHSHEYASALDLAELYADTLQKSNTEVHEAVLTQVIDMYSKLFPYSQAMRSDDNPKGVKTDSDCRKNLLNKLINWSTKVAKKRSSKLYGSPKLHLKLARLYSTEKNYEVARTHYFVSEQPEEFAEYLISYWQSQNTKENIAKETLIAQAVFQCLFFKKVKDAVLLFQHYVDHHPDIGYRRPYKAPLLNFVWIVLRSVYSQHLADFTSAIEAYKEVVHASDPTIFGYLERIGQIYFQLPSQSSSASFLASIFKGFLGTNPSCQEVEEQKDDEEEEEDLDWEDAGDTQEFLTEPLPSELFSKLHSNKSNTQTLSPSPSNAPPQDGSEMDLD